ncbi:hypothetical protein HXX76_008504 [Chlamydomonas incerta]|uniref:MYND-type domain-containing protein n=1 Tax=Chlamydomonas incerta TaxID=51695 RepID=A0A835SU95_CHLIN|nr:hypothetical protein HXX76_008504 [Chlamydomonas incerta]|eukprot:KAG2433447.1 hypothetical protein HXX76_008504 [Chlamydomonas incerta]
MTTIQHHAAQLARSGGGEGAGRPAPLPPRLESFSRAAQSVLLSHLLRRHARLAEQAATAASAAVADTCSIGDSAGISSSSSRSAATAGYQAAVLGKLLSALTATLSDIATLSHSLLLLQPAAAAPVPQRPPAAASRGGGGAGGKGKASRGSASASAGPSAGAVAVIGGASTAADRARPLAELLVLELGRSGFLDQVARLVLHGAQADGAARRRQQQQQQRQPELTGLAACSGSSNSSGVPAPLSLPSSDMTLRLAAALCDLTRPIGAAWCAAALARSSSIGTGSSCGLPQPWRTCLQTLALAQVVAALGAAGFGGGERGVWGLPAEMVAGLPLLAHVDSAAGLDLRVTQHQQPSGGGRVEPPPLCADPFSMLMRMARSLNSVATAMPTAACAAPGCAPTSAGACGADSAGADTGAGERSAGSVCWSFPISPRAMALVLLRVADLAVASLDRPLDVAVAAAGEAAAAPVGLQAPASLLRLRPADAWSEGMNAVLNAKQLLVRRRTRHWPQQQMAGAAPVARSSSAATGGGGDNGGGGIHATDSSAAYGDEYGDVYPRLPMVWWRTLAGMLPHAVAPPPPPATSSSSGGAAVLRMSPGEAAGHAIEWARMVLAADMPPPDALLQRAPPALAAALAGGLVAGVEAAVRAASGCSLAIEVAAAFLKVDIETVAHLGAHLGACWPLLQQLLAFAPPAQAAALVTSLGKQGHLAVDGIAAAVDGDDSAALAWMRTVSVVLPDIYLLGQMDTAAGAAVGAAGGTGGDCISAGHAARRPPHVRRLQVQVSHALHRWLPVLSRCARLLLLADRSAGPALPLASPHVMVLHWCVPMLWSLACEEAAAADGNANLITSRAAANSPEAAAAAMAARAAAAASWRQLLFHDIELVPMLEAALRMLAARPAGDEAAAGAVHLVAQVLALLPQTVPDMLAPVLRPPLPPGSPWRPAALAAALQKHMPGGSAERVPASTNALDQLRAAAAMATPAELRAGYMGGPVARWAAMPRVAAENTLLLGLSPLEVEAAAAAASCRGGSAGGGSGAALSSSSAAAAAAAAASKWTLRCCANPRCTNLAGRSDAELPLQACAGCGAVRYCSRACQTAHWRAGHKEACGALKGRGGAGADAAG